MPPFGDTARLTIDLDALGANWHKLAALAPQAQCAAVVKADAYGIGADRAGPALWRAGCRRFFVAHAEEALRLRATLPQAVIHALHGVPAGAEADFVAAGIAPVLSTPAQIERWRAEARRRETPLPAALQIDTGMNRLGLQPVEAEVLAADPGLLAGLDLQFVMSHLACADEPGHPLNEAQRERFAAWRKAFPALRGSLVNSAGIFLGPGFHHDILRPGIALYGSNPMRPDATPEHARAAMHEVVRLQGVVLQVRAVDSAQTVGYGASYRVEKPGRIATLAVGYADGLLRALSNRGRAAIRGRQGYVRVPFAGRVSMDLITLDVSALDETDCAPGALVDLLGGGVPLDEQAAHAGTIAYELLTDLGPRYARTYIGTGAGA